jgi:histone-binding protein RBBP4
VTAGNKTLKPQRTFHHHTQVVNDVQYHPTQGRGAIIGSVSDDLTLQIIDTRRATGKEVAVVCKDGHSDAINALAFHPSNEFIVATASTDKTIGLWDLRYTKEKTHTLEGHHDAVTSLQWHPDEVAILGSSGYDRRVMFWDLSMIGEEQQPEDAEDGPPEL